MTPKEYASITKDLVTAVSLYQSIAEAHHPESETPFDILPSQDSGLMLADIEDTAKAVAQESLPSDTTKALPSSSDNGGNPDTDSSETSESSAS